MNRILEFISDNLWMVLILLGVVGQMFTPNPKKRQQARERERAKRLQRHEELSGQMPRDDPRDQPMGSVGQERQRERPRTDPDDIAERIRELFEGKRGPVSEVDEDVFEEAPVLAMQPPVTPPPVRTPIKPIVQKEAEVSHAAVAGAYFDPNSIGEDGPAASRQVSTQRPDRSWAIKDMTRAGFELDPKDAIRAMLILGPPRALASYDDDPLLSRYQSLL